jgi:hypothetical protein
MSRLGHVTGFWHPTGVSSQVGNSPHLPAHCLRLRRSTVWAAQVQRSPARWVALWSAREMRSLRPFCLDVRQPAIWGCAGKPAVPLSYGGGYLRAWHTGATSTTFCRSGSRKRLESIRARTEHRRAGWSGQLSPAPGFRLGWEPDPDDLFTAEEPMAAGAHARCAAHAGS